jgi:hypothetical protein
MVDPQEYEKQIARYASASLPPIPESAGLGSTHQQSSENLIPKSVNYIPGGTAMLAAARKSLRMSKAHTPRPHVLDRPKEFAASAVEEEVYEGV